MYIFFWHINLTSSLIGIGFNVRANLGVDKKTKDQVVAAIHINNNDKLLVRIDDVGAKDMHYCPRHDLEFL
jgi:hypothetical protein